MYFIVYIIFSLPKKHYKDKYSNVISDVCVVVCVHAYVWVFSFLVSSILHLFVPILKLVQFHKSM